MSIETAAIPVRTKITTVYSNVRVIKQPLFSNIDGLTIDQKQKMSGLALLSKIGDKSAPLVFFDPQYRGILDKQSYGNEGKTRGKKRSELMQMTDHDIKDFIAEIDRILIPSGHLMLWVDKFILCEGFDSFISGTSLNTVDLITWNKDRMGMECYLG